MGKNKRFLSKYDSKKRGWLQFALQTAAVVIIAVIVFFTVIGLSRVDGHSMEPELSDSQVVAFLRLGQEYGYGDIVAIKMPSGDRYVKRIIGLPGDTIDIREGIVYRNGEPLEEDYVMEYGETFVQDGSVTYPYELSEGRYFVLGDNREVSVDSRTFGQIIEENIKGRILFH